MIIIVCKVLVIILGFSGFIGSFLDMSPANVILCYSFPAGWAWGSIIGEWLYSS